MSKYKPTSGRLSPSSPPRSVFTVSKSVLGIAVRMSQRRVEDCLPLSAKFMIFRVYVLCVVISRDKTDPSSSQGVTGKRSV